MANRLAILIPGGRLLLAIREGEAVGQRTFSGVVTRVEQTGPNVYFYVDVKNRSGKVTNWAFEGWLRDSLKVGDRVTVVVYPTLDGARDGESMGSEGDRALRRFIGSSF